ncbi:MAG: IS66 family transposase [Streptosporangiaceae bacterium]
MPSSPDSPAVLRAANARLRAVIEAKDAQLAAASAALNAAEARIAALGDRVAELERRAGQDSSTSSRPPSSDSPYKKKPRDRSLRGRSGRGRGKQPGAESSTLRQVPDPGETIVCAPAACSGCGADLAAAAVSGVQKLQVFDITPPPPPQVTEYQVQARECGRCGAVTAGQAPAGVTGRAQYGPEVHARAANLASAHHIPVARAAQLMGDLAGVGVSAGFMAGVRGKAAARCEPFMEHVRGLLRQAGIQDAGGVLPGYAGVIVRDGYAGYAHLTDANAAATAARAAGQPRLPDDQLAQIRSWYRGAVAKGIADNEARRTRDAADGLRLARRFRDHQDMILRFTTDLAVGFTSNQAERDVRPVKASASHRTAITSG